MQRLLGRAAARDDDGILPTDADTTSLASVDGQTRTRISDRRQFFRTGGAVLAAAAVAPLIGARSATAVGSQGTVGPWEGTVTFVSQPPPGVPPQESVLLAFDASGTLVLSASNPPTTAIGAWRPTGVGRFAFSLREHLIDASTGQLIGIIHVEHTGMVSDDHLTSSGTGELYDLAGNPIAPPLNTALEAARIAVP